MADVPLFPVLIQCVPPPSRRRSLFPIESLSAVDDDWGDQDGWVANERYRIIDSTRHVFSATYDGSEYQFRDIGYRVTDAELCELMCGNIRGVGGDPQRFLNNARTLEGNELFQFAFRFADEVPVMSLGVRIVGCTFILFLCVTAFVLPILLVKFLWK